MSSVAEPRTSVHTSATSHAVVAAAAAHGLDLMLLDGALERVTRARERMEHGENLEKHQLLSGALQIVDELRSSLDVFRGGPFAVNLDDLCDYMSRQMVTANLQNRIAPLDEVSHLLREVRTAWAMLPPEARTARAGALRE